MNSLPTCYKHTGRTACGSTKLLCRSINQTKQAWPRVYCNILSPLVLGHTCMISLVQCLTSVTFSAIICTLIDLSWRLLLCVSILRLLFLPSVCFCAHFMSPLVIKHDCFIQLWTPQDSNYFFLCFPAAPTQHFLTVWRKLCQSNVSVKFFFTYTVLFLPVSFYSPLLANFKVK